MPESDSIANRKSQIANPFVSRGGLKLEHALSTFGLDVAGLTCADFGCSTGGFTDCLLRRGAARVYAVDTGYGVLDYGLRRDGRVVVMERTNAMHVALPEAVDLVVIDAGWTRQRHALPAALRNLKPSGRVVTLVKPHYESQRSALVKGVLPEAEVDGVLAAVVPEVVAAGFRVVGTVRSPILGAKGNAEVLAWLEPDPPAEPAVTPPAVTPPG